MRPIKTASTNFTYLGDEDQGGEIGNLPVERPLGDRGPVYAVYELDDDDRAAIAAGGQIKLGIETQPIPPVSLQIVDEPELADPGDVERARRKLAGEIPDDPA